MRNPTTLEDVADAVAEAVRRGDPQAAARVADWALRRSPKDVQLLRLAGEAWLLADRPGDALALLDKAAREVDHPDLEAAAIDATLRTDGADLAAARLIGALGRFAVAPGSRLAQAARKVVLGHPTASGWIGLGPDLAPVGEARADSGPPRILRAGVLQPQDQGRTDVGGWVGLGGAVLGPGETLAAESAGRRLFGSPVTRPADYRLDGRAFLEEGRVRGWVRLGWSPVAAPELVLEDAGGERTALATAAAPDLSGRFAFDAPVRGLTGATAMVLARLPDGNLAALPDQPIVLRLPAAPRAAALARQADPASPPTVVVPVYRGLEETLACLASVRATTDAPLVVVEDASPEPDLVAALQVMAEAGEITLLRNPRNLGFSGAANRGIAAAPDGDVVLLNSDVEVFEGWLDGLRAAAMSASDVGSVSAFANEGSILSYPRSGAPCSRESAAELARLAARLGEAPIEIPTGIGHCLYLRRACLDATGPLDERLFRRGYGEENDFSLRARAGGWRHLAAPAVFVRHLGELSFGSTAVALRERNLRLLNRRWRGYDAQIQDWLARDPAGPFRRALDEARLRTEVAGAVLLVSHARGGGVGRFVGERADGLAREGRRCLTLRPTSERSGGWRLEAPQDPSFQDLLYGPTELDRLVDLMGQLAPEWVEIHHFVDGDPALAEALVALGRPYDVFVHDWSWICPRITLIGPSDRYCGEPEVAACAACIEAKGAEFAPAIEAGALRQRSARWLAGARRVVAPSKDAAARLERHFDALAVEVRPWEASPPGFLRPRRPPTGRCKVALMGAIGDHKGYGLLLDCARDAARRDLPLEFVVVGYTQDDGPLLETDRVLVTGAYEEAEAVGLLLRESPDLALFASVWPETWCYALTPVLAAGLPVAALDIGAIAERLRTGGAPHRLLPLDIDAAALNDALLAFAGEGAAEPPAPEPDPIAEEAMTARSGKVDVSGDILPLAPGLYRLRVASASRAQAGPAGVLLPAVHVSAAPGAPPGGLTILAGLGVRGDWLVAAEDQLILKAEASPTLVLVTSLSADPAGRLELIMERLDGAAAPAPPRAPPAAAPAPEVAPAERDEAGPPEAPAEPRADGLPRLRRLIHVAERGDLIIEAPGWSSAEPDRLPIEGFSLTPLDAIEAWQIEYKAISAGGSESPWTSGGRLAGARGMAVPLTGLAVRLRQDAEARWMCVYRARFRSGRVVGPVQDGAPCLSSLQDDWLEAIEIDLVPRQALQETPAPAAARPADTPASPRFSVFREPAA